MSTLGSPRTSRILVWRALHPLALAESIESGDMSISARVAQPGGGGDGGGGLWEGGVLRLCASGSEAGDEETGTRRAAPGPAEEEAEEEEEEEGALGGGEADEGAGPIWKEEGFKVVMQGRRWG
jgi:hypothetical protein